MNSKPQIKLTETVVLVDTSYLNFVVSYMKGFYEKVLGRVLQDMDVSIWATCLTLDAGIKEGANDIQFLFVYDNTHPSLVHAIPSDLTKDLNGVAFRCPYGEYSFASVPTEGMVTREELFLDLLSIVADSADVKRILVVGFQEEYGEKLVAALNEIKGKDVIQFLIGAPASADNYRWDTLAYPVMQALGIRGDEI